MDNRGLRCSGDGRGCGQVPRVTGGQLGHPVDNFSAAPNGPQIGEVVHTSIPRCGLVRPQVLHRVKVAQVSPMWVTVDNFSGIGGRSGTPARQKSSSGQGCGRPGFWTWPGRHRRARSERSRRPGPGRRLDLGRSRCWRRANHRAPAAGEPRPRFLAGPAVAAQLRAEKSPASTPSSCRISDRGRSRRPEVGQKPRRLRQPRTSLSSAPRPACADLSD